ncbi:hypothetical protein RchiOBHm_Chr6g0311201 [Rosa chinensis]|uniref:Transmembrane protein n=1 Tax=Rosa chinensis TaxID=74649 RepID=A0A2P6Q1E8_ROSCH|nr:hypothetical protein RchiOBHm_Chr6g0311201 [Rosa chinensis]
MGRSIPTDEADLLIHPVFPLSLFAAGMAAATIAMITALCSFRRKRPRNVDEDMLQSPGATKTKEEALQPDDVKTTEEPAEQAAAAATTTTAMSNETTAPQEPETVDEEKENEDGADFKTKELPLPPGKKALGLEARTTNCWNASNVNTTTSQIKKSASERRLLSNLSIKLPRSLSMAKRGEKSKDESNNKRKNGRKLSMSSITKQEESIWMKTIILGEKCKVPEEDDIVIYDAKGRKIPAYHPKSRQNSLIDQTAIPNQFNSRQWSFIDPSAIPDQGRSNATNVEIDQNKKDGDHQKMISSDHEELMSLSQL